MKYSVHKEIVYFDCYSEALNVRAAFLTTYPKARVVGYQRGYAVQREKSGPYLCVGQTTPGSFSFR